MHILVTTLGTTWQIVPEAYGCFTDLYGEKQPLETFDTTPPKEIWIITTQQAWEKATEPLQRWANLVGSNIRVFQTQTNDLETQNDVAAMRELIFRVVLQASETATELSCSLAGGRKTMSADMQEAARLFGCQRLLHILANGLPKDWPDEFRSPAPSLFACPLQFHVLKWILPVILSGNPPSDLLDLRRGDVPPICSNRFPPPQEGSILEGGKNGLCDEIEIRKSDSSLLSNFISAIEQDERHENWRSLYRLPPRIIERLRKTPVGPEHSELLRQLPKAELHCHIGGILNLNQQRTVAEAIWTTLSPSEKTDALAHIQNLDWNSPEATWSQGLKKGNRPANVAAVFHNFDADQLQTLLFPPEIERTALKSRHPLGFAAYELPGELSGSAVLGHHASLAPTVSAILDNCRAETISYLELRGSPHKYCPLSPIDWLKKLALEFDKQSNDITTVRFIWIADRRQKDSLSDLVKDAAHARDELPQFLVGLDLAGDEAFNNPEELAPLFLPAFKACLPITIHAGEGESADNIWQAAYHLHADRIGHGLSLAERPDLLARFRDRGICLELCPSSNREVVGYSDPDYPKSSNCPNYPISKLWSAGVPLTLCTDNPGISRCSLSQEYINAARMSGAELTLWDALAMTKRAYVHSFVDADTREKLLKTADPKIHVLISRTLSSLENWE